LIIFLLASLVRIWSSISYIYHLSKLLI